MNKVLDYYAMLMTKWVPSKPTEAIMPFFLTLIVEEEMDEFDIKQVSESFKEKYGFEISYFLIHNMLCHFIKLKVCVQNNDKYQLDYKKIVKSQLIDQNISNDIHTKTRYLLQSFISFADDKEITYEIAENVLLEFTKNYDIDFIHSFENVTSENQDVYMYFFIEYVKKIYSENQDLYNILVSICEGNMIRSILLNESIKTSGFYKGQKIFLDTPIVLKVLGYYGEFIQKEYEHLVSCWLEQGAEVYIYDHSVLEIESILLVAEKWVESLEINYAKTSEVTLFFRKKNYSQEDIINEKIMLKESLDKKKIKIYVKQNEPVEFFYENEDEIKDEILTIYNNSNPRYYFENQEATQYIDYDVKSIVYTYLIRNNNQLQKYNEAKAYFVTNNRGIIKAVNNYHKRHYPHSLMPVIKDTYIGMIVAANSSKETTAFVKKNMIAFCYGAYKPSKNIIEKYINKVDELKYKNEIDEKKYFLLRNHADINQLIAQKTLGFSEEITDHTIYEIYDEIKEKFNQEIILKSENDIKKLETEHRSEIKNILQKNKEQQESQEKKMFRIASGEYKKRMKRFKISYIIVIIVLILIVASKFIFIDLKNLNKVWQIIITVILLGIAVFPFFDSLKSKKIFLRYDRHLKRKIISIFEIKNKETIDRINAL